MRRATRKVRLGSERFRRRAHLEVMDNGTIEAGEWVMTGPDDAVLARAAQAGDAASMGVLFERHRARLHAVAVGMLGHGSDAEDAVQDTIVIAMRRSASYASRPPSAAGWSPSWSTSAARSCAAPPVSCRRRTPRSCAARSTASRRPWSAARCATGSGPRWSACPSLSASWSCCATSRPRAPTPPSPRSATCRSGPYAAA